MARISISNSISKGSTKLSFKQDKYLIKANKYKNLLITSFILNIILGISLILTTNR